LLDEDSPPVDNGMISMAPAEFLFAGREEEVVVGVVVDVGGAIGVMDTDGLISATMTGGGGGGGGGSADGAAGELGSFLI